MMDNSAPFSTRPMALIYRGKSVQINRATSRPSGMNMLQQQEKFERFVQEYNNERPHQAIEMKRPADLYQPSERQYTGVPPVYYPFHDKTVTITACGRICVGRKKIHLSTVLAGHDVGIKQVDERIWLVSFMNYDLGYFDLDSCRVEPIDNPFGPRVLTMSQE
jgi:putative transposase